MQNNMISVHEAESIVLGRFKSYGNEKVDLDRAIGRVLGEPIMTDRDLPPYHRVCMDGIAIQYQDFAGGQRTFSIDGVAAAGSPQIKAVKSGRCIEVMTGAVLPFGLDTVIRYEDIRIADQKARIELDEIAKGQNIHLKGDDKKKNSLVIEAGQKLSAAEIGICASVGKSNLQVKRMPRIIIISTGDELVDIEEKPMDYQIRKSNISQIKSQLEKIGVRADDDHLPDDKYILKISLENYLLEYDAIILSGGVSKGKFDYVPQVLEELLVKKHFHKVKQRPGKPFWFGSSSECVVFALPGNPNSSFVCTLKYVIPWVKKSSGHTLYPQYVQLDEGLSFAKPLTMFACVQTNFSPQGTLLAKPISGNGSGDFSSLTQGDGFIELPEAQDSFKKGEVFKYYGFR